MSPALDTIDADKIMHAMLETDSGFALMASDTPPGMGMELNPGDNISISLSGDDADELRGYWEKVGQRHRDDAAGEADVGRRVRHVRRPVRHPLDGQHRPAAGLTPPDTGAAHAWLPTVTVPMVSRGALEDHPDALHLLGQPRRRAGGSGTSGSTVRSSFRPERRWCHTPATTPSTRSTWKFPNARSAARPIQLARLVADHVGVGVEVGQQPDAAWRGGRGRGVPGRHPGEGAVDLHPVQLAGQEVEQRGRPGPRRVQPVRELLWRGRPVGVQVAPDHPGEGGGPSARWKPGSHRRGLV